MNHTYPMLNAVLMAGLSARQFCSGVTYRDARYFFQDPFQGWDAFHTDAHKKVELNSEMTDLSIFGSRCPMHSFGCLVTCVIEQFFFHDCAPSRRHGIVVWRVNSVLELNDSISSAIEGSAKHQHTNCEFQHHSCTVNLCHCGATPRYLCDQGRCETSTF